MSVLLICVVLTALIFDFTNGFHDAANAIGTTIATRALTPGQALVLAAVLNVAGALLSTSIAATISQGIVEADVVTLPIVFAGLLAAITWNLATWYFGIPSSSSHCLIGGIVGAVACAFGFTGIKWTGLLLKVVLPTFASPVLGFIVGFGFRRLLGRLFWQSNPVTMNRTFRGLQIFSAGTMALSHGLNDGQKTMGVITLALFAGGSISALDVPTWVKFSCAIVIGLGTLTGGKRIIRTIGTRIAKLSGVDGFCAQTAGTGVLQIAAYLGLPVSTTQAITATVMGVGAARRMRAVHWGVTKNILIAWFFTLPVAACFGALFAMVILLF